MLLANWRGWGERVSASVPVGGNLELGSVRSVPTSDKLALFANFYFSWICSCIISFRYLQGSISALDPYGRDFFEVSIWGTSWKLAGVLGALKVVLVGKNVHNDGLGPSQVCITN